MISTVRLRQAENTVKKAININQIIKTIHKKSKGTFKLTNSLTNTKGNIKQTSALKENTSNSNSSKIIEEEFVKIDSVVVGQPYTVYSGDFGVFHQKTALSPNNPTVNFIPLEPALFSATTTSTIATISPISPEHQLKAKFLLPELNNFKKPKTVQVRN